MGTKGRKNVKKPEKERGEVEVLKGRSPFKLPLISDLTGSEHGQKRLK